MATVVAGSETLERENKDKLAGWYHKKTRASESQPSLID